MYHSVATSENSFMVQDYSFRGLSLTRTIKDYTKQHTKTPVTRRLSHSKDGTKTLMMNSNCRREVAQAEMNQIMQ